MDLIRVQWSPELHAKWKGDQLPDVTAQELLATLREGFESGWNWRSLVKSHHWIGTAKPGAGIMFEQVFAAIVRHFVGSADQAVMNAELTDSDSRHVHEELDLVVNTGKRLLHLDLKLTDDKDSDGKKIAVVDQFAKAAKASEMLGGLSALGVLVRPTWNRDPGRIALAKAFRLQILFQEDMPQLFESLAKLFSTPIPATLADATKLFNLRGEDGCRFFSTLETRTPHPNGDHSLTEHQSVPGLFDFIEVSSQLAAQNNPLLVRIAPGRAVLIISKCRIDSLGDRTRELVLHFPNGSQLDVYGVISPKAGKLTTLLLSLGSHDIDSLADIQRQLIQKPANRLRLTPKTPPASKRSPTRAASSHQIGMEVFATFVETRGKSHRFQSDQVPRYSICVPVNCLLRVAPPFSATLKITGITGGTLQAHPIKTD